MNVQRIKQHENKIQTKLKQQIEPQLQEIQRIEMKLPYMETLGRLTIWMMCIVSAGIVLEKVNVGTVLLTIISFVWVFLPITDKITTIKYYEEKKN